MTVFLASLLLSVLVAITFKLVLHRTISWPEFAIQAFIGLVIGFLGTLATVTFPSFDTQVLNSFVHEKKIDKRSCSHSYDCNPYKYCYKDSQGRNQCETRYKTCYEHDNDYDWDLKTGLGTITIDRIDRQGKTEPPRWSSVKIGDPVSRTSSYVSYIKSRPQSLFNESDNQALLTQFQDKIPTYPDRIYDYYRIDRLITVGVDIPDKDQWNLQISKFLNERGATKQLNVVVIVTNESDKNFTNAISAKWLGGKKNDVITVIGSSEYPKIDWVEVISWTDRVDFKVNLRNELSELDNLSIEGYFKVLGKWVDSDYVRKPHAEFKFLMDAKDGDDIVALLVTLLVTLIANIFAGIYFHKHDI